MNIIYDIVNNNNIIGKGSFGKIYYYPELYPFYVVKKMDKYNIHGNNLISNNTKELWWYSLISKYNSDILNNVSKLIEYNVDSDYIYLLLEHKGSSIYSILKNIITNNDKDTYIEILKNIPIIIYSCSKLFRQLHYTNLRHGDITTSNIMFNKNETNELNKISIIDWGSIVFSKLTINNYNQCAIPFVPPELNENLSYESINLIPSIKSDIFSLGLVILHILDPSRNFTNSIDNYIKNFDIFNYQTIDNIINDIIKTNSFNIDIKQYVNERVFYLLSKMLELNLNTRIDIDSLYMDELFTKYRTDKITDKYFLKNILKLNNQIKFDCFKNLLVENTYNFLKMFKCKLIKNLKNSKFFKYIDTQIILIPSIKLFYTYINKIIYSDCKDCLFKNNNLNHYIVSFLCCIKLIDIIFNDDISIYYLFDFYNHLYSIFSKNQDDKSLLLNLINFNVFFDLTFYNIFKMLDGIILDYPYYFDIRYEDINFNDIKKLISSSEYI